MKHKRRSVSVIVPTYNRANYIGEAIDSLMVQDIADCDLEIIVVDDGSKDNTEEVVRSYGERVRYIRQENQGVGVARNRGIEEARGEWVAFLDSDDRWLPFKLSLQFKVLDHFPEIKVIHSNFYTFNGDRIIIPGGLDYWVMLFKGGNTVDWSLAYPRKYRASGFDIRLDGKDFDIYMGNIFSALLHAPYGACWTMLINQSCLSKDIRFAAHTFEDYWFLCKVAECNDILFIDVPTVENRQHSGPRVTTRNSFIDPLTCYLKICDHIYMNSHSPFKPEDTIIRGKRKEIYIKLLKEYLKIGDLKGAVNVRKEIDRIRDIQNGSNGSLYRLLSYVPFNVVSHLVRAKRNISGAT